MTWEMPAEDEEDKLIIDFHVDSDWAKGTDRKSKSRGLMIRRTVVKHWWRTRASPVLSVAETEYRAIVMGTAEGLGAQWSRSDLGLKAKVRIWTGSITAKATASRRGLGEHKGHRVEMREDQFGESENQESARRVQFAESLGS